MSTASKPDPLVYHIVVASPEADRELQALLSAWARRDPQALYADCCESYPDWEFKLESAQRAEEANRRLALVSAGVGPGHPRDFCERCGCNLTPETAIATCTATRPLTLCRECYRKAGSEVR
jgi:hypothetical protein